MKVGGRVADLWGYHADKVSVTSWAAGGLIAWIEGAAYHVPADKLFRAAEASDRPNPLAPLVWAWHDSRPPKSRSLRAILPASLGERIHTPTVPLPAPDDPGPVEHTDYLPGLVGPPPAPALLIALSDPFGDETRLRNGKVSAASRIWLEVLLSVPPDRRTGDEVFLTFRLEEIVSDWLGWDARNFRTAGKRTGRALKRALRIVDTLWFPTATGGYFPVKLRRFAHDQSGLSSRLTFGVRLPPCGVGPAVDRAVLRNLRDSAPAFNAYLSLSLQWDRYGARGGKLIRPTVPVVRRDSAGYVVDAQGTVLLDRYCNPTRDWHHRRAVRTGEREPNPSRDRYPLQGPDDQVKLAFPTQNFTTPTARKNSRRAARAAIKRLVGARVVVVEEVGSKRRLMPPDLPDSRKSLPASGAEAGDLAM